MKKEKKKKKKEVVVGRGECAGGKRGEAEGGCKRTY